MQFAMVEFPVLAFTQQHLAVPPISSFWVREWAKHTALELCNRESIFLYPGTSTVFYR